VDVQTAVHHLFANARGFEVLAAIKGAAARDFLFETAAATAYLANRAREDFIGAFSLTEQEGEPLRLITAGHTDSHGISRMPLGENAFHTSVPAAAPGGPRPTP
jgi:two-component system, NarL family, response regulator DevR